MDQKQDLILQYLIPKKPISNDATSTQGSVSSYDVTKIPAITVSGDKTSTTSVGGLKSSDSKKSSSSSSEEEEDDDYWINLICNYRNCLDVKNYISLANAYSLSLGSIFVVWNHFV